MRGDYQQDPGWTEGHRNGHGAPPALAAPAAALGAVRDRARPRTVLVLGGGGMKGFAHVGVIRALERLGIVPDEVYGTSMGAVIGGLYASGLDSYAIEQSLADLDLRRFFRLNLLKFLVKGYRHASVYKGRAFHDLLREKIPARRFADLQMPFVCNALSLTSGALRYFGLPGTPEIPVADAIYASSCLPGVFEPIAIDGDHYIDGGMAETLPLKAAKARKPDLVIAVDLSRKNHHKPTPYRATLPHILFQTYEIMGSVLNEHNLHRHVTQEVVLLKPHVENVSLLEEPDLTEVVRLGEREALETLTTHANTRHLCDPKVARLVERTIHAPRDYVALTVDMNACIHCGVCAITCATQGYADVPFGNVVRKLHNYECTKDGACERNCPTRAIRLENL
ncbi:MAG TPA: patatin-like phospholipase family protein [Planctomycetota bacterium]|nr:patatin-like phospholipase family protein [Planctomycetota bacterium]